MEELDQKILPLGEVSTIVVPSPHKSPLKLEGSMTMQVRNFLSRAVLEMSTCGSKHSSPRRPTPAVVPMAPPNRPEGQLWPVDTSSQASTEVEEASLEDIPPASPQLLPFPGPEALLPWWMQWSSRQIPTKPLRIC